MTNGTQTNLDLKGTIYPSFQIGTNGPTIYQGTTVPSLSIGIAGDIYVYVNGSSSQIYQNDGTAYNQISAGTGTVTDIETGTGLTGGPITSTGTISIAATGVTPGTYGLGTNFPQIVVNAQGQITFGTTIALGSIASQGSNDVTITGGTVTAGLNANGSTIVNLATPVNFKIIVTP